METQHVARGTVRNGIDVEYMGAVAEAISARPETGRVVIRTRHRWDGGFAVDGSAEELESAGEVMLRSFAFRSDWPRQGGGTDSGPTPGELVLAALGGCLASAYASRAAAAGVDIDELEVALEAEVDLRGRFELGPVRPGLGGIKATVMVRSPATDETLDTLGEAARSTSPVYDTLANPVPIELAVDRLPARSEQR